MARRRRTKHYASGKGTLIKGMSGRLPSDLFDSPMFKERLEELRGLARPRTRADLGGAEKLEAPITTPTKGGPKGPARAAKAAAASYAPIPEKKDKVSLLQQLLARVRAGRRQT